MFWKKKEPVRVQDYDRENLRPAVRSSICTGEQVAGFRNLHSGKFQEVMLIRSEADLEEFKARYGLDEVETIY